MTQLSYFDHLITHDTPMDTKRPYSEKDLIQYTLDNISLNIQYLLATKCFFQTIPTSLKALELSVLNYGTIDFSSPSILSETNFHNLLISLKKTLSLYEPRLRTITVKQDAHEPGVFVVKATLYTDTIEQDVLFEIALTTLSVYSTLQKSLHEEEVY